MFIKRYHASWLIAMGSLGIMTGVVLAVFLDAEYFSGVEWLIVGLSLTVSAIINRRFPALLLLLLAGTSFGLWRGSNVVKEISKYDNFYG